MVVKIALSCEDDEATSPSSGMNKKAQNKIDPALERNGVRFICMKGACHDRGVLPTADSLEGLYTNS